MMYMGIDPGQAGGITVLSDTFDVLESVPMPATLQDLWELISKYSGDCVA